MAAKCGLNEAWITENSNEAYGWYEDMATGVKREKGMGVGVFGYWVGILFRWVSKASTSCANYAR